MPTCSPLDGRVALRRAAARRRRRAALAAARGSTAAAAAAAAAEVLGSTPTMAAAADKEPVRVERETPIPPHPAPGVGRSGQWQTPGVWPRREQRAGRHAMHVGGVPTSAAGGARAQMPWRMIPDDSPSSRTDNPAHAWAVRGAEVTGSEHHDEEKQDRVRGAAHAHCTA